MARRRVASPEASGRHDVTLSEALGSFAGTRDAAAASVLRAAAESMAQWAGQPLRRLSASDLAELIDELVSSGGSLAEIRRRVAAVRGPRAIRGRSRPCRAEAGQR
jgi:hypothetical protein